MSVNDVVWSPRANQILPDLMEQKIVANRYLRHGFFYGHDVKRKILQHLLSDGNVC